MASSGDHAELTSQFCEMTGASEQQAIEYLSGSGWDITTAVPAYFADQDEAGQAGAGAAVASSSNEPEYTGPRTLDGRPAPQYAGASSGSGSKRPKKRTGLATLGSMGGGHDHDHGHSSDDDDEDETGRPRDLFAGGEKSGLAVQDPANKSSESPMKLVNDILAKAKAAAQQPQADPEPSAGPSTSRFRGAGQTLGGDGVESRTIPDPRGSQIPTSGSGAEPQERTLHLWSDGFSIDGGPLRRFDDPAEAANLQMIREGRAPIHLMNVNYDQPVNVRLQQHEENFRRLPGVHRSFEGEGRRLGSPVPGAPAAAAAAVPATSASTSGSTQPPSTSVDESQPTLMLRIQLPDGTRLPARFNTTQTVDDVYQFIQRSFPSANGRPWVLATTFPSKDHTDKSLVLGEMAEFKKGGAAVVKWT